MATLLTVESGIESMVLGATSGLISQAPDTSGLPITVRAGIGWPSAKALQDNVRKGNNAGVNPTALITIFDRGLGTDTTRWLTNIVGQSSAQTNLTATLSANSIGPYGTVTLALGGSVVTGDAMGLVFRPPLTLFDNFGVVPTAAAADTLTTLAAQCATLINSSADLGTNIAGSMISASASGPVVTLTSLQDCSMHVAANTGNTGTQTTEIARRNRHFQIVVWTRTPDDRSVVADQIELAIAQSEANFGLTFPDGTLGRMTYYGDVQHDEATLSDTFRRDFLACVEYGITTTDTVYSVLAPILQYRVG
jgi:hypothetical protein